MKKANKSDIVIKTKIKTLTGDILSYLDYDWRIELYVSTVTKLIASHSKDGSFENCSVVGENILIYVDGFDWGAKGAVIQETTVFFPNENFQDGSMKSSNKQVLNLVIE